MPNDITVTSALESSPPSLASAGSSSTSTQLSARKRRKKRWPKFNLLKDKELSYFQRSVRFHHELQRTGNKILGEDSQEILLTNSYFLCVAFLLPRVDWKRNKLRVILHKFLNLLRMSKLLVITLKGKSMRRSSRIRVEMIVMSQHTQTNSQETLRYNVRRVPLGRSLSGSVSSLMVKELAPASPSQTYCLSDFGLFVETTTCFNQTEQLEQEINHNL